MLKTTRFFYSLCAVLIGVLCFTLLSRDVFACWSDNDCNNTGCANSSCSPACGPTKCCQIKGACIGASWPTTEGSCGTTGSCYCGSCSGGNGCTSTRPHAPALISPTNNTTVVSTSVTLQWNHDGNWGTACNGHDDHFKVYVRPLGASGWDAYLLLRIYDPAARTYVFNGSFGTTYEWRIGADNGPLQQNSSTRRFAILQVNPPRATLSANGGQTTSVVWGSPLTFNMNATDSDGDLNRVSVYRRCISGDCYADVANRNWVEMYTTGVMSQRGTYTGSYNWGSVAADAGVWEFVVNAYDARGRKCSGNPDLTYPTGDGWDDCNAFGLDLVRVSVLPRHTINGYIFETDGTCTEDPSGNGIGGVSGSVAIQNGDYPASDAVDGSTGLYEIPNLPNNYEFDGVCFSGNVPSGDADWRYDLACASWLSLPTTFYTGSGCLWGQSVPISLTSSAELDFGYRRVSTIDVGWFTSVGGGIFSGGSVYRTIPDSPVGFTGHLMDGNGADRYALAGGDIDVAQGDGTERVGDYGYMENMGGGISLLPVGFNVDPPTDATEITTLSNLDPEVVYVMDASVFDSLISGGTVQCDSAITGDGVVVLYVEDGGTTITFDRDFCSNPSTRRILIVTDASIVISRGFGIAYPDFTSDPNIGAYILTTGDVVFEGTSDAVNDPDLAVVVDGGVASLGEVRFERDLGLSNVYPAEVVRYNHGFLYDLTKQAHENPDFAQIGLFQTVIEWYVGD